MQPSFPMDIVYRRRAIHCIPIGDARLHAAQAVCPCHPLEMEDGALMAHNAWDAREGKERATGQKASEGWVLIAEYEPVDM